MHKTAKLSSVALLTAALFSTSAFAADVLGKGSTKDADIYGTPKTDTHSGFYIKGDLGIAQGDRNIAGGVSGARYNPLDKDGKPVTNLPTTDKGPYTYGDLDVAHFLPFGKDGDFDSTVFGGEVSYLFALPGQRFGIELGLGGTVYNGGDTTVEFDGRPHDFLADGSPKNHGQCAVKGFSGCDPNSSIDTVSGSAKFERDFDIDLVAKAHLFIDPRFSVYAGGGVSWARASLKGGHDNTNPAPEGHYDNAYDENESSFGYVIVAGAQYWVTDRITVGLDYSYKAHEFDFTSSSSTVGSASGDVGVLRTTSDNVSVDDDVHTVKAKIGFKLN